MGKLNSSPFEIKNWIDFLVEIIIMSSDWGITKNDLTWQIQEN